MKYKGKELHEYSKAELIAILEKFIEGLKEYSRREEARGWTPPKNVNQSWSGEGKPGGR